MSTKKPTSIDEYISTFPEKTQIVMKELRQLIHKLSPDAKESISYGMPTFTLKDKYLIYFAAYKKHIGVYPAPIGIAEFKEEFSNYKTGKGSIQFPLDHPMPFELISKIINFNIKKLE